MPAKNHFENRFWPKVNTGVGLNDCWHWTALKDDRGYGYCSKDQRTRSAYRAAYELIIGPVPEGLELDHVCRNPSCVNPVHLDPVTHQENVRRGLPYREKKRATHCRKGHEFTPENTDVKKSGARYCKLCDRSRRKVEYGRLQERLRGSDWQKTPGHCLGCGCPYDEKNPACLNCIARHNRRSVRSPSGA